MDGRGDRRRDDGGRATADATAGADTAAAAADATTSTTVRQFVWVPLGSVTTTRKMYVPGAETVAVVAAAAFVPLAR